MDCPRCDHANPIDAMDCERCGVIFEKWEAREQKAPISGERIRFEDPPALSPKRRFELPMVLVAAIALAGLLWIDSRVEENEALQAPASVREPEASAPLARDEAPGAFDIAKGLTRLDGILKEIQNEGEGYGFTVSVDDLHHWFEKGAQPLHTGVSIYKASLMGLSPPERQEFSASDREGVRKGGNGAKCRVDGQWVYTASLPLKGPDGGVDECWRRLSGTRPIAHTGNEVLMAQGFLDWWERRSWQPHNKRWAPYPESTEQLIRQYIIEKEYGLEAEWKDREASTKQIDRIEDSPHYQHNPTARISFIKQAVLMAYKTRVLRAGARYRLEYEQSR